jgi:hypothetical protein
MRHYFETKYEDRYTGQITMMDGRIMEFKHHSIDSEEAYLMDVETGEVYPIVRILYDDDGEIYVTEV